MGGDSDPKEIERLSEFIMLYYNGKYKIAWYSGNDDIPHTGMIRNLDYIKIGSYQKVLGGLCSENTNQRFFKKENQELIDITFSFRKKAIG